MSTTSRGPTAHERYREDVAAYVAAGGEETVQRVTTAINGLHKRLGQWYDRQLVDLGLSQGEWAVLSQLATCPEGAAMTPTQLADAAGIAPSSMTHRLDRMSERELVSRSTDPANRTRVRVTLTATGWEMFSAAIQESDVVEGDVLKALDPAQRGQLAVLLERVIAGFDDVREP
ncbi:MarR family winged helix-turn-helix transcriptional regulator [Lapillicoccus sp.]|uniref:MarR family winged helix-turn-helix transcriptional regulator n=1 Tax=Lapillicoccus sp. TaxID=1909287 RepID=UPI003263F462